MRLSTITIKLLLVGIATAGLINIFLLLRQYQPEHIDQQLITTLYRNDPSYFYYALFSAIIIIALILWQSTSRKPLKLYRRFQDIDSHVLDNNTQLAYEFYKAVLFYRTRYGHRRYLRHIVKHFDFFYDYHNYALSWIDEVVGRCGSRIVPDNFILSTITSGHIGRVYYHAHYASGLPASNLKPNSLLLFHDCTESIEIWSCHSRNPLCKLKKESIRLQTAHRHPNYISAILAGTNPGERDKVMVELRFLTQNPYNNKQQRSEAVAKHMLHEFQKWLKQMSRTKSRYQGGTGIEVSEIVSKDSIYTTPLVRHLEQLVYRKIDAFYPRARLPITDSNIPLDALVLCKGIGLLAISEKHEQGEITYSGDPIWYQYLGDEAFELKNPCMQAKLVKSSLSNLLATNNLTRWPITSLVIYSKDEANLNMAIGTKRLQCNVLKLSQLEKWINKHQTNPEIQFTQNDITLFNSILVQNQVLSGVV